MVHTRMRNTEYFSRGAACCLVLLWCGQISGDEGARVQSFFGAGTWLFCLSQGGPCECVLAVLLKAFVREREGVHVG